MDCQVHKAIFVEKVGDNLGIIKFETAKAIKQDFDDVFILRMWEEHNLLAMFIDVVLFEYKLEQLLDEIEVVRNDDSLAVLAKFAQNPENAQINDGSFLKGVNLRDADKVH